MKMIELTQGKTAQVCDCHAYLLEGIKWSAHKGKAGVWYSHGYIKVNSRQPRSPVGVRIKRKYTWIKMHRLINNTPNGLFTDHKDGNGLNNQCSNLRNATNSDNMKNSTRSKPNSSGHKGVYWFPRTKKWMAMVNGRQTHLGYFVELEDAIRVRESAAREHYGEFYKA